MITMMQCHFPWMLLAVLLCLCSTETDGKLIGHDDGMPNNQNRGLEDDMGMPFPIEDSLDEKPSRAGGQGESLKTMADAKTAYKYQNMAMVLFTEADNIANEDVEDPNAFYMDRIASISTEDVVWDIDAGARKFSLNGTDAVGGLWESFASRKFGFHQLSHFETFEDATGILFACRYHGVVLEAEGNYQDIFGVIQEHFNDDDLIDNVFVQRFHTIDRGYSDVE